MKVIIAGSRGIHSLSVVVNAIRDSKVIITEVVSGGALGVDKLGEQWASANNIPLKIFPAGWNDISSPHASVRRNSSGKKYNALAGFWRNKRMAEYADALIAVWDGKSKGTKHMIETMFKLNKSVFVFEG